jgi:hypothetical protein
MKTRKFIKVNSRTNAPTATGRSTHARRQSAAPPIRAKMGRMVAAMVLDLIRHGSGKIRTVRIMPDFVAGGTLA